MALGLFCLTILGVIPSMSMYPLEKAASSDESGGDPIEALAYAVFSACVEFVTIDASVHCGVDGFCLRRLGDVSTIGRDHRRLLGFFGAYNSSFPSEFLIVAPVLSSVMVAP